MNIQEPYQPLTSPVLYILLVLVDREKHGYEIMKEVRESTNGRVRMGNGTLYGSIKRMLQDDLIEDAGDVVDEVVGHERRRYYRLTSKGRGYLQTEIDRYASIINYAKQHNLGGTV